MHRVVPELIIENYRAGRYSGEFPAAGLFLDLSGFSSMTDALMTHGQHGAEVLANLMHGVFDPLVESIFDYGGKIVGFAGDGIMALFPVEKDARSTVLHALASAWLIQERLANDPGRSTVYGKFHFTAKIGLTFGNVLWGILHSDDRQQATYFFRGSAVNDSAIAEHQARAGEIIVTSEILRMLGDQLRVEASGSFHRVRSLNAEIPTPTPGVFPPVDLDISRIFMPEEIIAQNARGEFRQVVNLFMHLPDLSHEKLEAATGTIFELRKKYGGLLNRIDFGDKGCNILMLWGAPVAYENDISRALNFILDLQDRVDFRVTAGVTYYVAHAGYLGSVMCEDYTCYGWGVNLASRFMMNAPVGEIWVDDRIARRVSSRFELESMGEQQFKGFSTPQKVHRLRRYNFVVDSVYQGELVGRDWELVILDKFIDPIWRGEFAGVLLVLGDAGIGKGRLVQGFRYSPVFESRKALWAFCQSEQILRQSFNPFRSWLLRYFGLTSIHETEARRQAFNVRLDDLIRSTADPVLAQEMDRLRSVLGSLVDLFWDNSLYNQLDPESRYNSTLLALISLIKAESLRQPVILFVEDVQFIDEDSLQFLPRLKRSISSEEKVYPIAVIATSRIENQNPVLQSDLIDQQVKLGGLQREAVARLVEILLGGVPSLELVNLVMERSEGNPYFVEQIIRYLQEEDLIEMSAVGWRQVERIRQSFLPGDIVALLAARLDQLSHKVKDVVRTASVLGREFLLAVLAEMTAEGESIEQHVNDAEQSAIWLGDPEKRYIFTHGLLRDAAYSMQMRSRLQELHALAVSALEKIYGDDLKFHYPELAHHSERASLREQALHYYILAGRSAAAAYQNAKGVEYFTSAITFTLADDLATRFDLLTERVELLSRLGRRDQQWNDLNSLEQISSQLKDAERMSKSILLRGTYFYFMGNYQSAIEYIDRAVATSNALLDTELGLYTQVVRFMSMLYLGRVDDAMQSALGTLERSRDLANRKEETRILTAIGLIALESSQPASSLQYLEDAVKLAQEIGDPALQGRAFNNLAKAEGSVNGNYVRSQECYEEAYRLYRMIGDRYNEAIALLSLGFTVGMQGNFATARTYHEQALRIAREVNSPFSELFALLNLSSLSSLQHQADLGLQFAQQASGIAQKISQPSLDAWALLFMGHAFLLLGDYPAALDVYRRSVDIRVSLNQPAMSMEPIAGLVEAYLHLNALDPALAEAEKILQFLEAGSTLDGTEDPLRIYYACYLVLNKKGDPRAQQILQTANRMLESQVSKFSDEAARLRYVENIPWRRAIRDLARSLS